MSDWMDGPEAQAWAKRALDELLPMLQDSSANISIVPERAGVGDIKFALELGLTIMLDKPLILAVAPGRQIPARLLRAADDIVEFDMANPARTQAAIVAALDRLAET